MLLSGDTSFWELEVIEKNATINNLYYTKILQYRIIHTYMQAQHIHTCARRNTEAHTRELIHKRTCVCALIENPVI